MTSGKLRVNRLNEIYYLHRIFMANIIDRYLDIFNFIRFLGTKTEIDKHLTFVPINSMIFLFNSVLYHLCTLLVRTQSLWRDTSSSKYCFLGSVTEILRKP